MKNNKSKLKHKRPIFYPDCDGTYTKMGTSQPSTVYYNLSLHIFLASNRAVQGTVEPLRLIYLSIKITVK